MPSEFHQVCGGSGFISADSYSDQKIRCIERYGKPCPECPPMPSESLPAKLRELATMIEDGESMGLDNEARVIRAAAERIEEQDKVIVNAEHVISALAIERDMFKEAVGKRIVERDRAREWIRGRVIDSNHVGSACAACDGEWHHGQTESHNSVTIDGKEGPCPARNIQESP